MKQLKSSKRKKVPSFRSGMSESIVQGWQTLSTGKGLRLPCDLDFGNPCRNDEVLAFMRLPYFHGWLVAYYYYNNISLEEQLHGY